MNWNVFYVAVVIALPDMNFMFMKATLYILYCAVGLWRQAALNQLTIIPNFEFTIDLPFCVCATQTGRLILSMCRVSTVSRVYVKMKTYADAYGVAEFKTVGYIFFDEISSYRILMVLDNVEGKFKLYLIIHDDIMVW